MRPGRPDITITSPARYTASDRLSVTNTTVCPVAAQLRSNSSPTVRRVSPPSAANASQQRGHHDKGGGLPATARPHPHHEAARLHFKGEVRQRRLVLLAGPEDLADIADLYGAGARRRLERGYVRQWLHRVSTDLTSSLKAIAIAAIITTPASNCFI